MFYDFVQTSSQKISKKYNEKYKENVVLDNLI